MGMRLKQSKCTSLCIAKGKSKNVPFYIGDFHISSINDKEQKFRCKLLFYSGKSEETFNHIKEAFKTAMENIKKAMVRNEYKLWMYKEYLFPSKRFLLTVQNLTKTQLKHIKKWSGLPKGATNALIHMKEGMDIKSIGEMYMKSHTMSHARTRLQGAAAVNNVLNCTLAREESLTTKKCTTQETEASFSRAIQLNTVQGEIPEFTVDRAATLQHNFNSSIRKELKIHMQSSRDTTWRQHIEITHGPGQHTSSSRG
jgi:hypothetical protein